MHLLRALVFLLALASCAPASAQEVLHEGFETWPTSAPPAPWLASGAGWRFERDQNAPGEGAASAHLFSADGERAAFGNLMRTLPAEGVRGKRIRLSALVRTSVPAQGPTALWLRVDRPSGQLGFFDNMGNRPIVAPDWQRFTIEGDVAADAVQIAFGMMQIGQGGAWVDDLRIEVIGEARAAAPAAPAQPAFARAPGPHDRPAAALSAQGLVNLRALAVALGRVRYYHPSDEAAGANWDRLAIAGVERVEGAQTPEALALALQEVLGPVAPSMVLGRTPAPPSPPAGSTPIAWRHQGVQTGFTSIYRSQRIPAPEALTAAHLDLGQGVVLNLPLTVWRQADGATWPKADRPPLQPSIPPSQPLSAYDRTTRLAGVILAWSTLREFYPYFDVVDTDWDRALDVALQRAAVDEDPQAFGHTVQGLAVALHDGHAQVVSSWLRRSPAPIALDDVEGRVVVVGAPEGAGTLRVGDVLIAVDGTPVETRLAREQALVSGSLQWRRYLALMSLLSGPPGSTVSVTAERADGTRFETTVRPGSGPPPLPEPRPAPVTALAGGLLYVDLTRLDEAALEAARPRMEAASGVVFDVRGYPQADPWYLRHLSDRTVRSAPFDIPTFSRPGQAGVVWTSNPWVMEPRTPRIERAVFIADESAISFSESVLGLVAGERLAPIVGAPTAGANGNINAMDLPGGYRLYWTGMRVTRHDGSPHHNVGVRPTVPQARTLRGIRDGRDELLERAVEVIGEGD